MTSLHEVSQGGAPEGVTAGRAFLILQEADDTDLGPVTQCLEEAVALMSWHILQLVQENYEEERLLRVSGKHKGYEVRKFAGADLQAIVDVEPQAGSAFPWNKTARQSYILDMMAQNPHMFIDPETGTFDQQRFRDAMPIGGEEAIGNAADEDVSEALREQDLFLGWDGAPETAMILPIPMPWQNHPVHLRQHAKVLKSAEFTEWPPQNQQVFIAHYQATLQAFQLQLMQQMAMQGPPGEGGGESGPPSSNGDSGKKSEGNKGGPPPNAGPQLYPMETAGGGGGMR